MPVAKTQALRSALSPKRPNVAFGSHADGVSVSCADLGTLLYELGSHTQTSQGGACQIWHMQSALGHGRGSQMQKTQDDCSVKTVTVAKHTSKCTVTLGLAGYDVHMVPSY